MGKGQVGREAGHHCTPGQGWRWQQFGNVLMLVTDGGGADVVLSGHHQGGGRVALTTCDPDGRMAPITPDSPIARVLVALPDLVDCARGIIERDDRPQYLPRLRDILQRAGVA